MQNDEIFLVADKLPGQRDPEYPKEYLEKNLGSRVVCVDVVVDGDGSLREARINRSGPACMQGGHEGNGDAFEASALKAVRDWVFLGSQICKFPPGVTPNDDCDGDGVRIEPVPVRLTYRFEFVQKNGIGQVISGKQG
ncbi:MAG: hypothetical protein QM599_05275 [Pseudoxanthomonas sp.]